MMAKRKYIRRDWGQVMEEYALSGMSATDYCKAQAINKYLFLRWQQKLAGKVLEQPNYSREDFVQLPIISKASLSIRFPGNVELAVPNHCDAGTLRIVIAQLKEVLC